MQRPSLVAVLCVVLSSALVGCRSEPTTTPYVARVGDQYLTQEQLSEMLTSLRMSSDTTEARRQIIEQWVSNALLYREAQRRDLGSDPEVQELLREQERSVLVNELTTRLYESFEPALTDAEIQAYYDQHREQMRLREPFAHVRHLAARTLDEALDAEAELRAALDTDRADSTWRALIREHASNPTRARTLAESYYPERQLFGALPTLRAQLERLDPGEFAPILEIDSLFHVLQLVERAETNAIPERSWVEEEIRRRLRLRARKQMYAREVQRLRNEALAREELEIR